MRGHRWEGIGRLIPSFIPRRSIWWLCMVSSVFCMIDMLVMLSQKAAASLVTYISYYSFSPFLYYFPSTHSCSPEVLAHKILAQTLLWVPFSREPSKDRDIQRSLLRCIGNDHLTFLMVPTFLESNPKGVFYLILIRLAFCFISFLIPLSMMMHR